MWKNSMDLTGRRALVTGASRGIGRAIAVALARNGADVVAVARDLQKLEELAQEIRGLGRQAWTLAVDVSDTAQIEACYREHGDVLGEVSIFINNAAITLFKGFMDTTVQDFRRLFDTNVMAAMRFIQLSAHAMMERQRQGSVTIITSINALRALPKQAAYSSTKAMLQSMMVSFANELAPYGIRVNAVVPGATYTDMNTHFTPEVIERLNENIPLGRIGESEDMADVVAFVVSDAARYMTGASVVVDGGMIIKR